MNTDIGFRDKGFYTLINHREDKCVELDQEECKKLFKDYKNMKGRTKY